MEMTNFLRKYNDLMSYNKNKPQNSLPLLIYTVIFVFVECNMFIALRVHPESLEKTILTVVDLVMSSTMFCYSIQRNEDVRKLMGIIEGDSSFNQRDMVLADRVELWVEIESYCEKKRKHMSAMIKKLAIIFFVFGLLVNNRNVFNYLIGLMGDSEESINWPTPYQTYCPPHFKSPIFFLYNYCLQSIMMAVLMTDACFVITLVCLSTERIITDFDILHILLHHLIDGYPDYSNTEKDCSLEKNKKVDHSSTCSTKTPNLRKDMARIAHFHQNLNKNFKDCVEGSGCMISIINLLIMLYCCTMAYLMLTATDWKKRLNFAMSFILIILSLFSIYHNGQRIFNQNDILRQTLAELPWTDKPQWFKQTLHIILTRANVDIEMRPYGIYTLNYMSFKEWIKFVFSTGNFLYTKKLKSQA